MESWRTSFGSNSSMDGSESRAHTALVSTGHSTVKQTELNSNIHIGFIKLCVVITTIWEAVNIVCASRSTLGKSSTTKLRLMTVYQEYRMYCWYPFYRVQNPYTRLFSPTLIWYRQKDICHEISHRWSFDIQTILVNCIASVPKRFMQLSSICNYRYNFTIKW